MKTCKFCKNEKHLDWCRLKKTEICCMCKKSSKRQLCEECKQEACVQCGKRKKYWGVDLCKPCLEGNICYKCTKEIPEDGAHGKCLWCVSLETRKAQIVW